MCRLFFSCPACDRAERGAKNRYIPRSRYAHIIEVAVKTICRTACLLFLLSLAAFAQDARITMLDAAIEKARTDLGVPGLAVAIVKDDSVVLSKGYGIRDMRKEDPVDNKTLFAIASNTKAFTATLIAMLVDDGRLSWDDRVQEYLPYFQVYDPSVSYDVRVRDLLCHRVGHGTYSGDLIWYGTPYSREEVVRRARHLPQAFPFRAGYGYSNIMYIAAGEIIEKASGSTWEQLLRDRILAPLAMDRTVLSVSAVQRETNVATPHGLADGALQTYPWYEWDSTVPAGGIISCVSDLSSWLRLMLNRGVWRSDTLFTDRQSRIMWTPHTNFVVSQRGRDQEPHTNFSGYGLGWSLQDYDGHLVASHGGGYDGMFSRTLLVPDMNLGVVVLTNSMTGAAGAVTRMVLDAYLGKSDRDYVSETLDRAHRSREREVADRRRTDSLRVRGTKPSFPLSRYAGTYGGPMYGDATVTVENGKLVLRLLPNPDLIADLSHWHYDVFEARWRTDFAWFGRGTVRFVMDESAAISELRIVVPNDDFWFEELEFSKKQ